MVSTKRNGLRGFFQGIEIMPKRFELVRFVFASASVALLVSFTGCRTATDSLATVPGFAWLNRGDEGWAQFEPAPDLPRPADTTVPSSASGISNIAKNAPRGSDSRGSEPRGSASRDTDSRGSGSRDSFNTSTSKLASKDHLDKSRYVPKGSGSSNKLSNANVGDKKVGEYASAFGKYQAPKPLNQKPAPQTVAGAQTGPYDVETPKYTPNFAKDASPNNFAKSGYDLGYESSPATPPNNAMAATSSKPYVRPSTPKPAEEAPAAAEEPKPAPFGYVAGNRFEAGPPAKTPTAPPATAPRFAANETYTPPGFAKTTTAATNQLKAAANGLSSGVASANNVANRVQNGVQNTFNSSVASAQGSLANAKGQFTNAAGGLVNKTSNAVSQTFDGSVAKTTQQGFNKFAAQAKGTANSLSKSTQKTLGQYPNTAQSRFGNAISSTQNQITSAAQSTAKSLGATAQKSFNNLAGNSTSASEFTQGFQQTATNAVSGATNAVADARASLGSQAQQATNYGQNTFNKFANGVSSTVKNTVKSTVGATPSVAQFQTYAQQAQQQAEKAVANTYNQSRQNVEQSVSSQYQIAKSTVGEYANTTVAGAQNTAANVANTITNSSTFQAATNAASSAQKQLGGVLNSASNAFQNVSASAYPTTKTPNPYVVPGPAIKGSGTRFSPAPSASSAPSAPPSNYNIPPTNNGPAFRTATPFLPGSTQSFQGAQTTRKVDVELASANAPVASDDQLVLAVGDAFQFPRTLR